MEGFFSSFSCHAAAIATGFLVAVSMQFLMDYVMSPECKIAIGFWIKFCGLLGACFMVLVFGGELGARFRDQKRMAEATQIFFYVCAVLVVLAISLSEPVTIRVVGDFVYQVL